MHPLLNQRLVEEDFLCFFLQFRSHCALEVYLSRTLFKVVPGKSRLMTDLIFEQIGLLAAAVFFKDGNR